MSQEIKFKSHVLKFLQKHKIPFEKDATYTLRHCMPRAKGSPRTCQHGFMDLKIELWKEGDKQMVSFAHYYIENGDLMSDPRITYKLTSDMDAAIPLRIQQDGLFAKDDHVFVIQDGQQMYKKGLLKDLESFTKIWFRNLLHTMKECKEDTD